MDDVHTINDIVVIFNTWILAIWKNSNVLIRLLYNLEIFNYHQGLMQYISCLIYVSIIVF